MITLDTHSHSYMLTHTLQQVAKGNSMSLSPNTHTNTHINTHERHSYQPVFEGKKEREENLTQTSAHTHTHQPSLRNNTQFPQFAVCL